MWFKLIFTGLFEMVRAFVIKERYYFQREWHFVFITPLSASSEKKVKPKSITFDKQCLVWLPYLSLCRALFLGQHEGKERRKENTISITVTGRREMCTYSMLMTHQENAAGMQSFHSIVQILCTHRKNHNISEEKIYRSKDVWQNPRGETRQR